MSRAALFARQAERARCRDQERVACEQVYTPKSTLHVPARGMCRLRCTASAAAASSTHANPIPNTAPCRIRHSPRSESICAAPLVADPRGRIGLRRTVRIGGQRPRCGPFYPFEPSCESQYNAMSRISRSAKPIAVSSLAHSQLGTHMQPVDQSGQRRRRRTPE